MMTLLGKCILRSTRLKNILGFITAGSCLLSAALSVADATTGYTNHEKAQAFVTTMVEKHNFDETYVKKILSAAEKKQNILDAISRPAEKTKPWHEYRKIFLGKDRVKQGVEFWKEHESILNDVSAKYGVAPEIIVAIIGVETRYGKFMGRYRVIDALTTLGFDYPRRGKFFTSELEHFFLLTREQGIDPLTPKGSYAGAMGYGQFIPSSYRNYARDHDGDNKADIWTNKQDAIASVANYFKAHGWQTNEPVFTRAKFKQGFDKNKANLRSRPKATLAELIADGFVPKNTESFDNTLTAVPLTYSGEKGDEYWIGFNNFYVITRYNRSHMYALAVWQLSEAIAAQKVSEQTEAALSKAY